MIPQFDSWVWKFPWRRDRLPTPVFLGFPGGSASKESTCNAGDLGLIPGLGRSPGEGNSHPFQYSCLENPMNRGAWQAAVHGVTKRDTTEQLSLTSLTCHEVMELDAIVFVFWMLSFKPAFSLSSLTLVKRLFSSSLLSAIRVVSAAYLKFWVFLQAILIPPCESSSQDILAWCILHRS